MGLNWEQGLKNASESLGMMATYYGRREEREHQAQLDAQRDAANQAFQLALHKMDTESRESIADKELAARTQEAQATREFTHGEHELTREAQRQQHQETLAGQAAARAEAAAGRAAALEEAGSNRAMTAQLKLVELAQNDVTKIQGRVASAKEAWDKAHTFAKEDDRAKAYASIEKQHTDAFDRAQAKLDTASARLEEMQSQKFPSAMTSKSTGAPAAPDVDAIVARVTQEANEKGITSQKQIAQMLQGAGLKSADEIVGAGKRVVAGLKKSDAPAPAAPATTAQAPAKQSAPAEVKKPTISGGGGGGGTAPDLDPATGMPKPQQRVPEAVAAARTPKLLEDGEPAKGASEEFLPTRIGFGPGEVSQTKVATDLADKFQDKPNEEAMRVAAAKMGLTRDQVDRVVKSALDLIQARTKNPHSLGNVLKRTLPGLFLEDT